MRISNDGNRGRYWTLNRVLDWVRGYNPALSLDRILAELYELCLSGRVRARLPVPGDKGRLVPDAPFERIPAHSWIGMGFAQKHPEARPTGVYACFLPRGVTVEAQFYADDVLRELQPLAETAPKPSRLKPFWVSAEAAIEDWLVENGCPRPRDGNQAALERYVAEWLTKHGYGASEAAIRRHVARCIARCRVDRRRPEGSFGS